MRSICAISLLLLAMPLAGCASFSGQPEPVISVSISQEALASYEIPGVLVTYGKLRGRAQRAYRDEVIAVYTQAIDARYYQFRGNLSTQNKGSNLAFDALLVGLVGAAALSPNDADEIAAVTTGVLGLRGSIDKSLYYERTLPALLAAMDGERYKVRTSMAEHIAQDTAQYPLAAALVELQEYQQAGTVIAAITSLTNQAAVALDEARQGYERRVRFACDSEDSVNVAIDPVGTFISDLATLAEAEEATGGTTALNRLRSTADAFGISGAGTMNRTELETALGDALLGGFCSLEEIDALKRSLRQAGVGFTAT